MTTILTILVLIAATTALVSYVRNDHFASSRNDSRDELGRALAPPASPALTPQIPEAPVTVR